MGFHKAWELLTAKTMGWGRGFVLLLPNLLVAIVVLIAFWLAARLVKNVLMRVLRRISQSEQVNQLLAYSVFLAVLAVGTFVALGILGLQKTVASLLAGAGIITLALGFAFQDIAANLMAGIYLSVQRPFRPGHIIETKDFFGVVKRIHLRWTELRTQQGQVVLIPNKQVFENPIMNYSSTGERRVDLRLGVSYGDDLEKARQIAIQAVQEVSTRLPDKDVEFFYEEFGESSINFVVRFWIAFQRQPDFLAAQSEAIERIKRAFDENGITIPFPIRTLDFAKVGGETFSQVLEEVGATPDGRARSARRTS
ncbi:MAG TPA: mechanosensitive ion channel [Thermoanaerobaculia bacterium]|nr:mechanosensitive ion channel [Thermoanaerobaculia bacterium]